MQKLLVLLIIFQITGSLSALASNVPRYQGAIKTITSPLVLKYRPLKRSTLSKTTTISVANDATKVPEITMSGFMEAQRSDDGLIIEINGSIPNPSGSNPEFNLKFSLSETGIWLGIKEAEFDGKLLPISEAQLFEKMFKSVSPEYSKTDGYQTGDNIHNTGFDLNFGNTNFNIQQSGKVLGTALHAGRKVVVADFTFNASFDGNELSGGGYSFIDIKTGFKTLTKAVVSVPAAVTKGLGHIIMNETSIIKIAQNQGLPTDNNTDRFSPMLRLKKLKKLLDAGLIDKSDYETKKNEILKDL
tara:strand:+ start:111 stop:1013 length:903 start_codon:yes stop_codon:yes gene_type:complete